MVMPPLRQTSMHSLIKACTTFLEERSEAASPKVQPRTALIPENAALIRSLLQRVPRKFSSTSTGPIFSRRALTSAKCLLTFSETAPNEKVRLSGELVNSQTPGPSIVAPQATVQPSTRDGPTISEISSSGNPFWRVTITPILSEGTFEHIHNLGIMQLLGHKEYDIIFTSHFLICQDGHRLSEIHGAYHSRTFGTQGGDVSLVMVDEVNLTSVLRNIRAQNGSQRTGAIDGTSHIP